VLGRCDDLGVVERIAEQRKAGAFPTLERVLTSAGEPR
jgi:hypothetical protein